MGVRALHRHAVPLSRQHIRRGATASDEGSARGGQAAIGPLRSPQPEFHDRIAGGGKKHPRRFRGNQSLEIDDRKQRRFQQLALRQGAADSDDRFPRKHGRSFGYGVEITAKLQRPQGIEKRPFEKRLPIVAADGF